MMSLAEFESAWQGAEVKEEGEKTFTPLPDGTYKAVYLDNSFDEDNMRFMRVFQVSEGPQAGRKAYETLYLTRNGEPNEVSWSVLKTEMNRFDPTYATLPISDAMPAYVNAVLDQPVEIWVKNKVSGDKVYTNVRVNKFLDVF